MKNKEKAPFSRGAYLVVHGKTDADIWMKNKEKAPFSRGAYLVVRNPQERVPLTQLFAK